MQPQVMPDPDRMYDALCARDTRFEGVFVVGVTTTGIFCRPSCPAWKPKRENVEFFAQAQAALLAGYRPCKRCRPLIPQGQPPDWLTPVLAEFDRAPLKKMKDADLRALGADPVRVRRWFLAEHGMTFHAYQRARRLGDALGQIRSGQRVTEAAMDSGYGSLSGFTQAFQNLFGAAPSATETAVLRVTRLLTPMGPMLAAASDEALLLLEFVDRRALEAQVKTLGQRMRAHFVPGSSTLLETFSAELTAYFQGRLREFSVPFFAPGTPFQELVWQELCRIPPGQTLSYKEVAERIGRPTSHRAVARANGQNRLAIVIPCHRVIAQDGSLSGYGGQIWRKRALLALEQQ